MEAIPFEHQGRRKAEESGAEVAGREAPQRLRQGLYKKSRKQPHAK
jgi:hypothetical protein